VAARPTSGDHLGGSYSSSSRTDRFEDGRDDRPPDESASGTVRVDIA
jgi:hypothetical protein